MPEDLLSELNSDAKQSSAHPASVVREAYLSALKHLPRQSAQTEFGPVETPDLSQSPGRTNQTDDPIGMGHVWTQLPRLSEVTRSDPGRPLRTRVIRRWTGVVEEVLDDLFVGRLTPSKKSAEELVAEFTTDEVSDDDLPLLRPGAWFYVNVAKQTFADGRQATISSLRFRRLSRWTEEELAIAEERAAKVAELLREE
jgi:hypothetical protein